MKNHSTTFDFLVEHITASIILEIIKDFKLSFEEAMLTFHNSETFNKLTNPATELYIESPDFVYETYLHERRYGTIRMDIQ